MPVIPGLQTLRQEGLCEYEASLGHVVSPDLYSETLTHTQKLWQLTAWFMILWIMQTKNEDFKQTVRGMQEQNEESWGAAKAEGVKILWSSVVTLWICAEGIYKL